MPNYKLPRLSGTKVVKIFKKMGFKVTRQSGSHIMLVKYVDDRKISFPVPRHPELDKGTLLEIIRQAKLTKKEFLKLIK